MRSGSAVLAMTRRKTTRRFHLLALSQHQVRLFECDLEGAREIDGGPGFPKSIAAVTQYVDAQKQEQAHAVSFGHGPRGLTHGHRDDSKVRVEEFLRKVDAAVRRKIKDKRAPLILATVDSMYGIYKKVNTHPRLNAHFVAGNPDRATARELHKKAVEFMKEEIRKELF